MTEKLIAYDPAAALVDDEEIAFFMADAVEIGDSAYIARARDAVARAKKVVKTSDKNGSLLGSE
jgi:DNA-binding phage protein